MGGDRGSTPLLAIILLSKKEIVMLNLNKRIEFKKKVNEMFLGSKESDYGPVRSDVIELLSKYEDCLHENEKIEVKESLFFVVQYLMHCRHCARQIDWILVERIIDGCLEF